jgi:hypothetical protein
MRLRENPPVKSRTQSPVPVDLKRPSLIVRPLSPLNRSQSPVYRTLTPTSAAKPEHSPRAAKPVSPRPSLETKSQSLKAQISQAFQDLDAAPSLSDQYHRKGEFYVLKRNYESLRDTFKENEASRSGLSQRVAELEKELESRRSDSYQDLLDLTRENHNLKAKLKSLLMQDGSLKVFEALEEELINIHHELSETRKTSVNVLQRIERLIKQSLEEPEPTELKVLLAEQKRGLMDLLVQLKAKEAKVRTLENDNFALKKEERRWRLSQKNVMHLGKRTEELQGRLGKQAKVLHERESSVGELRLLLERTISEKVSLSRENEDLWTENTKLAGDLKAMRDIATNIGFSPDAIERLHKNFKSGPSHRSRFALQLLERLHSTDPALHKSLHQEIESLYGALDETEFREQNLLQIVTELQGQVPYSVRSREVNKQLQKTLLSRL